MNKRVSMYPTMDEVEMASRIQLCKWTRFLAGPGEGAIGTSSFNEVLLEQAKILDRIIERLEKMGGMSSEISKMIGW